MLAIITRGRICCLVYLLLGRGLVELVCRGRSLKEVVNEEVIVGQLCCIRYNCTRWKLHLFLFELENDVRICGGFISLKSLD
jgi:hypothetical protein